MVKNSAILSRKPDPRRRVNDENRHAFTPHVYEIHGNVYYMHCSDEEAGCSRKFKPTPTLEEFEAAFAAAP